MARRNWLATLQVNLVRTFTAGAIWALINMFALGQPAEASLPLMIAFPLGMIPMGLLFRGLAALGVPMMDLCAGVMGLFLVVADPLLFFVHRFAPKVLPVERWGFLNFALVIEVYDGEVPAPAPELAPAAAAASCPFVGEARAVKDFSFAGTEFKAGDALFQIGDDWQVTWNRTMRKGWVDEKGGLHDGSGGGLFSAEVNPSATLSTPKWGEISAIHTGAVYVGREHVANLSR